MASTCRPSASAPSCSAAEAAAACRLCRHDSAQRAPERWRRGVKGTSACLCQAPAAKHTGMSIDSIAVIAGCSKLASSIAERAVHNQRRQCSCHVGHGSASASCAEAVVSMLRGLPGKGSPAASKCTWNAANACCPTRSSWRHASQ